MIAAATAREQALQKKLDEVSAEASRKESAQSARILDLETQLSAATADLERQVGCYVPSNAVALCTCSSNFAFCRDQLCSLLMKRPRLSWRI